jgi:hypothetical protein
MSATFHHIDSNAREILDGLGADTPITAQETARRSNVFKLFFGNSRSGYGPLGTVLSPKVARYRKISGLRWLVQRDCTYSKAHCAKLEA